MSTFKYLDKDEMLKAGKWKWVYVIKEKSKNSWSNYINPISLRLLLLSCHFFPVADGSLSCRFLLSVEKDLLLIVSSVSILVVNRNMQFFLVQLIYATRRSSFLKLLQFLGFLSIWINFFWFNQLSQLILDLIRAALGLLALFAGLVYYFYLLSSKYMICYIGLSSS